MFFFVFLRSSICSRTAVYWLGVRLAAMFSDLSVRKWKTEPLSILIFLPVRERVELPPASTLEVEVIVISPLAFAAALFTVCDDAAITLPVA